MHLSIKIILAVFWLSIAWVIYNLAIFPRLEMNHAMQAAQKGDITAKMYAVDMKLICDDSYRYFTKLNDRQRWSGMKRLGILVRCTGSTWREGVQLLEEMAETGNTEALYRLALVQRDNTSKHEELMRQAAEKGHGEAQYWVGLAALQAQPPRDADACFWLTLAHRAKVNIYDGRLHRNTFDFICSKEKSAVEKRLSDWDAKHKPNGDMKPE